MNFKGLIKFLTALNSNNSKDWFDLNRKEYEELRKEWIEFVGTLIQAVQGFDSSILMLDPKKCIFRINKDIRFSKDKSPYKTNFGAIITPGGKKEMFSGYYLHVDPKEIFIAGGAYQPMPELLAAIRQEIDYNFDEFFEIVSNKKAKLSRPPKGYEADNPAVAYLKHKGFIWVQNFKTNELYDAAFLEKITKSFEAMKPLNNFLNRCVVK
jgi:uncharacterized protein (TIGR02453 family)